MRTLNGEDWRRMVLAAASAVEEAAPELSRLDAAVGDGDHGVNVATAMEAARRDIEALEDPSPADVVGTVAHGFLEAMGGAAGALFGSFFRKMARTFGDAAEITTEQLAAAIDAGADVVRTRGGAEPGDKTMVDALAAAQHAARDAVEAGRDVAATLEGVASAAARGARDTTDMVAARGRARYAEEKSRGIQDAGATTVAIILGAFAAAAKEETTA